MTSKERILAALRREKPDKVPFMDLHIDHGLAVKLLGRECYTMKELADFLQLDGVGTGVYPNLYAHREEKNGRSMITGGMLQERKDLAMIHLTDPGDPALYMEFDRIRAENPDRAVFGATNMGLDPVLLGMGLDGFSYALMDDPDLITDILKLYADWAIEVVHHLERHGADIIWFTDDIAFNTSLMFDPSFFKEVARPILAPVVAACHVPVIYHSDGDIRPVIQDLYEMGVSAIHPVDPCAMDIHQIKRDWGDKLCLVGNIDLRRTLINAPLDEVEAEVRDRIDTVGCNGGYIISSANSMPDYCGVPNVLKLRDTIAQFG